MNATQNELRKDLSLDELRVLRHRGVLAMRELESPFWLEHVKPMLEDEIRKAEKASVWHPGGSPLTETVAMNVAHQGGVVLGLQLLEERLKSWLARGEKAAERLIKIERGS